MNESDKKIIELINEARREGRAIQFGERECCFCHVELDTTAKTLMMSLPKQPKMLIRLCRACAMKFDIEEGIFGLVNKG